VASHAREPEVLNTMEIFLAAGPAAAPDFVQVDRALVGVLELSGLTPVRP